MNQPEIQLLRDVYRSQKIGYSYFQDKYAIEVLRYYMKRFQAEKGVKMNELKEEHYSSFLKKPALKTITSSLKNNMLREVDLLNYQPENQLPFWITFNHWGHFEKHRKDSYYQTTRPGFSFVLQLNFAEQHDMLYHKLLKPKPDNQKEEKLYHPFRWNCHPVCQNNQLTLGWVRMDVDFKTGEILIEEIQNDWLRQVKNIYNRLCQIEKKKGRKVMKNHWIFREIGGTKEDLKKYYEEVLQPYFKIWDEALLSAAIWFSVEELGIKDIFYHTYKSGCYLKNCHPPRSIYTKLPKRFGFKSTNEAPLFIQNCQYLKKALKKKELEWWRLIL